MTNWQYRLMEAIALQTGGAFSDVDRHLLEQVAAAMERYLDGAIGRDCATVLDGDERLCRVAALRAQAQYDPLGVTPQQEQMIDTIIRDLSEQLRCEYRSATGRDGERA